MARAADADLDGAVRIDQPFLDGAADPGAVGETVAAEIAVVHIGVGVELDQADGGAFRQCPQDRQPHQVIAPRRHRPPARRRDPGVEPST
jgi:hypothetical protein